MKKNQILALLLALAMVLGLCACGGAASTAASDTGSEAVSAAPAEDTADEAEEPEPEPASAYNPDGSLCRFVSQDAGLVIKGILIRQDWLDKLGKDVPTKREDLEDILRLFQSEMGATMPLLMNAGLETGLTASFNAVFAGFRGMDFQLTEPNGKEVVVGALDEAGHRDIIETANGMGLAPMTELYQAAYDDYLAKQ